MDDTNDIKKIIASRLSIARKRSGLSQLHVSKQLNIPRPSISEIEASRRRVSAEELVLFADLYKVDINWLAGRNADSTTQLHDELLLAARDVANLKSDDLNKVIALLSSLRPKDGGNIDV